LIAGWKPPLCKKAVPGAVTAPLRNLDARHRPVAPAGRPDPALAGPRTACDPDALTQGRFQRKVDHIQENTVGRRSRLPAPAWRRPAPPRNLDARHWPVAPAGRPDPALAGPWTA